MIAASELVLHADGSVYHLRLRPEELADTVLMVGDPDRVEQVSKRFDSLEMTRRSREFVCHTGRLGPRRLSVLSSGIGVDNVEIVMMELDALRNIDLSTRTPRQALNPLNIIRLGTSGTFREDWELGSLVYSATATGLDSLLDFYPLEQSPGQSEQMRRLRHGIGLGFTPYATAPEEALAAAFSEKFRPAHTLTCPGFYAPQGRSLRLPLRFAGYLQQLQSLGFDNFEMETAGYYAFGAMLGHRVVSLSVLLAQRMSGRFAPDPAAAVEHLIETALEAMP